MDMELTEELKRILRCQGADLVGIGDMSKVENCNFKRGVAAVSYTHLDVYKRQAGKFL